MLAEQFIRFDGVLRQVNSSPEAMGAFVENATRNFKFSATDRNELEQLLSTLKASVLAMVKY